MRKLFVPKITLLALIVASTTLVSSAYARTLTTEEISYNIRKLGGGFCSCHSDGTLTLDYVDKSGKKQRSAVTKFSFGLLQIHGPLSIPFPADGSSRCESAIASEDLVYDCGAGSDRSDPVLARISDARASTTLSKSVETSSTASSSKGHGSHSARAE